MIHQRTQAKPYISVPQVANLSKERDARSDLANFIGEMVAKYADAMELDQLPDPDNYLRMKRIKQLYMELYKIENIEKSRSIVISIERNAAA